MGSGGLNSVGAMAGGFSSGLMNGVRTGELLGQKRAQGMAGGAERLWANQPSQSQQPPPQPQQGVGAFSPDTPQDKPPTLPVLGGSRAPGLLLGNQPGRQPLSMDGVRPPVTQHWEAVQGKLGYQVPIVSGFRDPATNARAGGAKGSQHMQGNAIDIDVSKMPTDKRLEVIKAASAQGFTGIGVYGNSLHLDMRSGAPVAWGPSHHGDSIPSWAASTLQEHMAGAFRGGGGTAQQADYRPETPAPSAPGQLKTQLPPSADPSDSASSRRTFGASMPLPARVNLVKQLPKPMQAQAVSGNLPPEGSGQFDLKTSIKLIQKAYPKASDLDIFRATKELLPFMNQDAAAGYKAMQVQMGQQRLDETARHNAESEQLRSDADAARQANAAAKQELDKTKEADKNFWQGSKEYRLGQDLQIKMQKLQDGEQKAEADMQLARDKLAEAQKKQADAMEIARKKVVMAQGAADFKQAQQDYKQAEDGKRDGLKQEEFAYKKAQDVFKNSQRQRADAERALSSMQLTGAAGRNPDVVKQDQTILSEPPPQVPNAGGPAPQGQPPAQPQGQPPAQQQGQLLAPTPEVAAKVKQALASGMDKEAIKRAVLQDGYDPAQLGL